MGEICRQVLLEFSPLCGHCPTVSDGLCPVLHFKGSNLERWINYFAYKKQHFCICHDSRDRDAFLDGDLMVEDPSHVDVGLWVIDAVTVNSWGSAPGYLDRATAHFCVFVETKVPCGDPLRAAEQAGRNHKRNASMLPCRVTDKLLWRRRSCHQVLHWLGQVGASGSFRERFLLIEVHGAAG